MPVYSFECGRCGRVEDKVFGMGEVGARRRVRCGCGGRMRRLYGAPQVRPDTWRNPRECAYLFNLGGDEEGPAPVFETRSAEREYKKRHEERYGWS